MIEDKCGTIDYEACGAGPTVVLVPGSCSTGAAWRPVIAAWEGRFRCITTSLLGYGQTAERRTARDPCISHEVEILESVVRKAGGPVTRPSSVPMSCSAPTSRVLASRRFPEPRTS
jgi:pimeloyl-ACP methyl ester carboxylesterase